MTPQEFSLLFEPFYRSFVNLVELTDDQRPLHLAHYTSLEVLEKIIQNNELWFSNPLFMNDHQEMRFGILEAVRLLNQLAQDNDVVASVGGAENFAMISSAFYASLQNFDVNHSLDVYVFCLSQYDAVAQPDGRLSMWRGYGANGQGAAIVFNTQFATLVPESPLLIAKVEYASALERIERLKAVILGCISLLRQTTINHESLSLVGYHMFRLALTYSLLSKHPGFKEEEEWRIIYMPDRDGRGLLKDNRTYLRRNHTIEPKLRFPIKPLEIEQPQLWTFDSILYRIVLGPTHGSILAVNSVKRMLESLGKPDFATKIWVSEIPYRPTGV